MGSTLHYSDRVDKALVSLYPVHFRLRFAPEMSQVFHDCCRDALEKGQVSVFVVFWFHSIRDFSVSILRERRRELMGPLDFEHPVIGIIDLMLIPSMITANLIALGPIVALFVLGGVQIPADEFAMTSGFFSFVIGAAAHLELVDNPLKPAMRRMRAFRRPTGLPSEDQAMGWQTFTRYEPEIVFHQGGTHGFHTVLALQPVTRRAVVVLSNSLARVDDIAKHSLEPRYPLEK